MRAIVIAAGQPNLHVLKDTLTALKVTGVDLADGTLLLPGDVAVAIGAVSATER
ncbi:MULTISPECIES: hypothetical protein [unclassified Crossiella]|uniref:hypothetical protein n=1 Tax=unclassified Crossiella TaxID=2620835 RepID=UPI001FFE67E5|nr:MULTISPECIES: hypothetical protein [unclassified Crossiella]MCK2243733.1 hypothetical protein [Crossiella sp. S99.2]MCK2257592.1 hypothetical protein [Crossiella sp. S99.1]